MKKQNNDLRQLRRFIASHSQVSRWDQLEDGSWICIIRNDVPNLRYGSFSTDSISLGVAANFAINGKELNVEIFPYWSGDKIGVHVFCIETWGSLGSGERQALLPHILKLLLDHAGPNFAADFERWERMDHAT